MHLNARPCKIGTSINNRTEKHGDKDVPAFDMPLVSIMLSQPELNALMGEPLTSIAWFNDRKDGLAEPLFKNIKHFALTDEYVECDVSLTLGLAETEFHITGCTISKLRLSPCVGGLTELRITVSAEIDDSNSALSQWMGKDGQVDIELGEVAETKHAKKQKKAAAQPELNLGAPAPGKRKRGRKSTAAGDSLN